MKLLLTNDDGYDADGIQTLADCLSRDNEVYVIAPDRNRSAVSNGITWMKEPLKFVRHSENVYSCSGLPADCVIAGLRGDLLPFVPDAVISGINKGANIGTDIIYSGTAAAARQAVLYGIPGIALSVESENDVWKYRALAHFAADNLEKLASLASTAHKDGSKPDKPCVFVNVNAPSQDSYDRVRLANQLEFREYHDSVHLMKAPDGNMYGFFCGGSIESPRYSPDSDFGVTLGGCIAVSRVYADPLAEPVVDDISFSL